MKSVCVYCGSAIGLDPAFREAACGLARELVANGLSLVYGGGNVGLMGEIANEVLRLGGEVTGVIPSVLMNKEFGHAGLTKLHVVAGMHERKALMAELSDGFIAMPGGLGTLEELFEVLTWAQIGLHQKPIGALNVDGFYDGLIAFIQTQRARGFVKPAHAELLLHDAEPAALIAKLQGYVPQPGTTVLDTATAGRILP